MGGFSGSRREDGHRLSRKKAKETRHTDLPNDLVVLDNSPTNVDAVVVPVGPGHVVVDIGVDSGHGGRSSTASGRRR